MEIIKKCTDSQEWDDWVIGHGGHPLQLWGWGEVKAAHGWQVVRLFMGQGSVEAAAQVLIRRLPWPFRALAYIPRGPVVISDADKVTTLEAVANYVKAEIGAVSLKIEPDWEELGDLPNWRQSDNTILIPKTLALDLRRSEEDLLATMSKKTRQYIRKSGKEGLVVRQVKSREELAVCLEIYHQTAARAGFALHGDQYYYDVYNKLDDHSPVIAAFYEDKPVAFLWLAISQATAFELYGGMNEVGQATRANYLLKWETIRLMKKWGVEKYDMNGLLNDGVSNFKRGFASHENMLVGTYDRPLSIWYPIWDKALPLAKQLIRKLRKR